MKQRLIGIFIAAIAAYAWGFAFWGAPPQIWGDLPHAYDSWKHTADDAAAGAALRQHFPEVGTYYLPGRHNPKEALDGLYKSGPIAFVHMTSIAGRPQFEPIVMVLGFLLYLVTSIVLSVLLLIGKIPGYFRRVGVVLFAGIAGAIAIRMGESVWWYEDVMWRGWQAIYEVVLFLVFGLILAAFIKPMTTVEAEPEALPELEPQPELGEID